MAHPMSSASLLHSHHSHSCRTHACRTQSCRRPSCATGALPGRTRMTRTPRSLLVLCLSMNCGCCSAHTHTHLLTVGQAEARLNSLCGTTIVLASRARALSCRWGALDWPSSSLRQEVAEASPHTDKTHSQRMAAWLLAAALSGWAPWATVLAGALTLLALAFWRRGRCGREGANTTQRVWFGGKISSSSGRRSR